MKFIHLTDTHMLPAGRALYGRDPAWGLRAAVDSINAEQADAAFCVVTGDLTHRGEPDAFAALAEQLARLRVPVHLLLGNHDARPAFRRHFPQAPCDPAGFVQSAVDTPQGLAVFLDTNDPGVSHGVFDRLRAQWLAERLAREPQQPVLLFMHHPPCALGIPTMDRIALLDAQPLWETLAPHRARIRHLFFGHVHRPLAGSWRGIPFSSVRGTNHQVPLELGMRLRVPGSHEPRQYGVVLVSAETLVVHMHDFEDRSARFDL